MSKGIWGAVALMFFLTASSLFAAEDKPSQQAKSASEEVESIDIESGCTERFNPYQSHSNFNDEADANQDICTT